MQMYGLNSRATKSNRVIQVNMFCVNGCLIERDRETRGRRTLNMEPDTTSTRCRKRVIGRRLPIAFLYLFVLTGCAQLPAEPYPSNFVFLDRWQVTGEMALMSEYMRQIDEILLDNSTISSEQQANLVKILVSIDEVTNRLGAGAVQTNHLLIDGRIDEFKSDVNTALRHASADPPNYFALGKLSGSCIACHIYR